MASNSAEIKWTTDDAAVIRSFEKIERNLDQMARKLDGVEKNQKKATEQGASGWAKVGDAVKTTAAAFIGGGSLMSAINMIRDVNRKMIEEAEEAGRTYDDLFRKFRVQAGLSEIEGEKSRRRILEVAERNAVTADVATGGAMGLVGAGFSTEAATGGALDALLRTRAAYNFAGKATDMDRLAKDIAAYFTSQGMQSTDQNLETAMRNAFALRAGAFELGDFAELGKHGAAFRRMSQQEQLAAFGSLVDAMPAAEAGTAMRSMVLKLTSGGRNTEQALGALGMKRTDVDLLGENFGTVLDRIGGALDRIPEEQRAPILKAMFEEAGVAPAQILLNERRGKYVNYLRGMGRSGAEFDQAWQVGIDGRNAAETRLALRDQIAAFDRDDQGDLYRSALLQEARNRGYSQIRQRLAGMGYDVAREFGASPDTAAALGFSNAIPTTGPVAAGEQTLGQAARSQLDRDLGVTTPVKVEQVNGGPRPVPARALDRRGVR